MSKTECTICPSHLCCPNGSTLADVENMARALQHIFLVCDELEVEHFIFDSAFDIENFPWSTIFDDKRLCVPLMELYQLIERELRKSQSTVTISNKYCDNCNLPESNWCGDLKTWMQSLICQKCIFVRCTCNNAQIESIETIKDESQLKLVKFPWLSRSDFRLPTSGDYPYIPPNHWKSRSSLFESHDTLNGYIDDKDNLWVWDRMHNDHWDVTNLRTREYKKVTLEGMIL